VDQGVQMGLLPLDMSLVYPEAHPRPTTPFDPETEVLQQTLLPFAPGTAPWAARLAPMNVHSDIELVALLGS
jgi:hypothetical protein